MKKTRIVALVLCISVMLMGASYAYWNDTLTINSTVSTGYFQVDFEQPTTGAVEDGTATVYATAVPQLLDSKTIQYTVSNLYPGATAKLKATVKNNGSIPAAFNNATVVFTSDVDGLKDDLQGLVGYMHYNEAGHLIDWNWVWLNRLNQFDSGLDTLLAGLVLQPGDYITFDIPYGQGTVTEDILALAEQEHFTITPDENCIDIVMGWWITELQKTEDKDMTFNITIDWTQHNAPLTVPAP